ncbi:hypothetical protein ACIHFD_49450 [Nonomuraea sp. NPDC051941]|uniref:hypothetical protein n=1 Tax=Nonomuraea sp. NPDC051941 TaxID=3364373 RepID=UPI0037C74D88
MIEVSGYTRDGIAYQLRHDPADDTGRTLTGSPDVLALLEFNRGEELSATPTGPTMPLDPDDASSVLCALYALTDVTNVAGDVPDLFGGAPEGSVH